MFISGIWEAQLGRISSFSKNQNFERGNEESFLEYSRIFQVVDMESSVRMNELINQLFDKTCVEAALVKGVVRG
jgi:hypothetical protein